MEGNKVIKTYSALIATRYKWYGWISGFVAVSGVLLYSWCDSMPWQRHFSSGVFGLGIGYLWYFFYQRFQLLSRFHIRHTDPVERLEKYVFNQRERWERTYLFRFVGIAILGATMFFFLFFYKESNWAGITASLFLTLLVALILKGWLDFNEDILLHDIRRNANDHTSE